MTLIEKIESYTRLWRVVLPHITEPSAQDAAHWCDYEPSLVERSILRVGRRFAPEKLPPGFNPQVAYRYTSGVLKSEDRLRAERDAQ